MSTNSSLQPPLIITSLSRPPASTSALGATSASSMSLSPAPSSVRASFSPYAKSPVPRGRRVAMEGKSLFTCHQCGALLRFQHHPVSIEEKIMKLRTVPYEHSAEQCEQRDSKEGEEDQRPRLTEGTDNGENTDADEEEELTHAARNSLNQQQQQQKISAVVPEYVWERQQVDNSGDVDIWAPVELDPINGLATYTSCNRGDIGQTIADVVPARLLNKPHLWVSDWEVDYSLPNCDDEGWVYAASHADLNNLEKSVSIGEDEVNLQTDKRIKCERRVRRRRLARRRRIDGSDLSWFQELLDCSSLLLKKRLPTCHDCEAGVLSRFTVALKELEDERDQYERFIADFEAEVGASAQIVGEDDHSEWQDDPEFLALQEEERVLNAQLRAIEDETLQVTAKRRELWSTGMDLEQLIHGTFAEGAFLQHLLGLSRDERQSVSVFAVHASDMLRRLQRYNVCNDVFHIWHDGLFGTINGLRLGRLPLKPVEWVEINAALGQAVLLLATIADRANFEFSRNRLVPRGSFSRVVNMYGKEYSLYSDGGMFRRRGFNQAMILFLECVEDAGRRAMKEEPSLKFPYKVERGKIGGLPISLGNDEQWTRALKYMLTHLKWLLAWISKRY
ncbi:putative atg6/Beclin, atg6, BARA domain, atg6/beclin, coiled-coil domain-containing protein [Plasmopara halstedii]